MQDSSFDDYDYTECISCHSCIQPYNNMPCAANTTPSQLASLNPYTKTLLQYSFVHCSKCGLYIKIHPIDTDLTSIQKIFICSNSNHPHNYCLCYHCGLLYGINPNYQIFDISVHIKTLLSKTLSKTLPKKLPKIEISQTKSATINQREKYLKAVQIDTHSLSADEREVSDNCNDTHSTDEETHKIEANKTKIDESYLHLIALQTKLHLLNNDRNKNTNIDKTLKNNSCPTSPEKSKLQGLQSLQKWNLSHSLRGSPRLGPSTPSPRVLGKDVDESERKWQSYLLRKDTETVTTDTRLEKQQRELEELQKLQRELNAQKKNSEQFAKLFRNGIYSKETVNKLTNFKFP